MDDIEIVHRILQITQIDKSRATVLWRANPAYASKPGGLGVGSTFLTKEGWYCSLFRRNYIYMMYSLWIWPRCSDTIDNMGLSVGYLACQPLSYFLTVQTLVKYQ